MLKTKIHDVFYIYLFLYHSAKFMYIYVRMQLAFLYTVLLCLHSNNRFDLNGLHLCLNIRHTHP